MSTSKINNSICWSMLVIDYKIKTPLLHFVPHMVLRVLTHLVGGEEGDRRVGGRGKPALLHSKSKFAVIVTTHAVNQLPSVATLPARPLILIGRICITKFIKQMSHYFNCSKLQRSYFYFGEVEVTW
jgi:hypothetical protein